jgi:hypothetical protein
METVTLVSLTVSGTVNDQQVFATGMLVVDESVGTKIGNITVSEPRGFSTVLPDCFSVPMPKCFVGAKPASRKVVNPLRLLGSNFVSMRVTDLGRAGRLSQTEHVSLAGHTLTSQQVVFGHVKHEPVAKVDQIREVIVASGWGHLTGIGRYTLVTESGKKIPVRYEHSYRTLVPNERLFHAHKNKKFLLKARLDSTRHGQVVSVRAKSTIDYA